MKILFYRQTKGIGDLAMMMKSVEVVRQAYPKAIIDIACRYQDLIRHHPVIDGLLNVTEYKKVDLMLSYDVVIDQSKPCAEYEAKHQPNITRNRIEIFCNNASTILRDSGYKGIEWDGTCQTLWIDGKDRTWANMLVRNASEGKLPIGIFWRSAEEWRDWKYIIHFVQMLALDSRFAIFCFDGKMKIPVGGIHQFVGYPLNKVNALVSCMRLIFSMDTVGIHIAGGLNVPILAVFGPTDPKIRLESYANAHWLPVKCRHHPCWYKPCRKLSCLRKIKPRDVYQKIEILLGKDA